MTGEVRLADQQRSADLPPDRTRHDRTRLDGALLLGVVVVLVFFLPARAVVAGLGAAGRPHLLVATGLLLWWLVTRLHPGLRPQSRHPLVLLALVYVGWLVLAWGAGYDRGLVDAEGSGSDRALIVAAAYLGIALVASEALQTREAVDRVLKMVVLGAAFSALMGWAQFWLGKDFTTYLMLPGLQPNQPLIGISERGAGEFARVAGTAGHYIEFGVVTSMLLPLAVHYALHAPVGRRKFRWLLVGLMGVAVPFSISRSAVVAFGLATAVMLIGWPRRRRWNAVAVLVVAVPAFMVVKPGLLGTIKSLFLNAANDPSISGRTEDYATAWGYISQRPVIGRGPGTFTPDLYRLLDNQWLLSLIETGWVGVVLLATLELAMIRVLLTIRRRALFIGDDQGADLALCLLAIVVTIAITSFFFDCFSFTTATTMFWLSIGVTAALGMLQRRQLADLGIHPISLWRRWAALVALARGRGDQALSATGAWI